MLRRITIYINHRELSSFNYLYNIINCKLPFFFNSGGVMYYLKLYYKLLDWEWYTNANVMRLFIHCLLKANRQTKKWQGITIKAGSFVTSYEHLAVELGLTVRQVRTALDKLKMTKELTHKGQAQYSIITVNNWNDYQVNDKQNDKQMTSKRQTNDKQMTTTRECNNDNNEKNDNKFINDKIVSIKKTDPYINPTKKHFIDKAKEILGFKPYLDASMCNKLIELSAEIDDFQETIPIVLGKIKNKKWKFADGSKDVTVNWLLKDSNYTSVLNGAFDFETREEIVARLEKAELERRRKYADSNSN